jgi:TPR repeat protein
VRRLCPLIALALISCTRSAAPEPQYCGTALYQRHVATVDGDACDRGDLAACVRAGSVYEHGGYFVPTAPDVAAELYRRACEGGDPDGCTALSRLLDDDPEP